MSRAVDFFLETSSLAILSFVWCNLSPFLNSLCVQNDFFNGFAIQPF